MLLYKINQRLLTKQARELDGSVVQILSNKCHPRLDGYIKPDASEKPRSKEPVCCADSEKTLFYWFVFHGSLGLRVPTGSLVNALLWSLIKMWERAMKLLTDVRMQVMSGRYETGWKFNMTIIEAKMLVVIRITAVLLKWAENVQKSTDTQIEKRK